MTLSAYACRIHTGKLHHYYLCCRGGYKHCGSFKAGKSPGILQEVRGSYQKMIPGRKNAVPWTMCE